jgi:formate hydrogenlyase subunit 6/NADH:ubiquinone oxidoreductase subunit I
VRAPCPIDCIVIDAEKDRAAGGLVMTRFDIDMAKCMYCGLEDRVLPVRELPLRRSRPRP